MGLNESILELIRSAATDLSIDVEQAIQKASAVEENDTPAANVFNTILKMLYSELPVSFVGAKKTVVQFLFVFLTNDRMAA